jgi:prepilin-type N-terminal cleavage/methylation domain-containing protein
MTLLEGAPVKVTTEHNRTTAGHRSGTVEDGFTLIELMLVLLIFSVLTAAASSLSLDALHTFWNAQGSSNLLDPGLQALNQTLDQMQQDIRLAGHPDPGSFSAAAVASHPGIAASSFTTATGYDLVFQGDVNGDGQVEQVEYTLPPGSQTLMRLVTPMNGSVPAGSTVSQALLSNVQNQLIGQAVFSYGTDPLTQNIQTVYVSLILKTAGGGSSAASNVALTTACGRMNP